LIISDVKSRRVPGKEAWRFSVDQNRDFPKIDLNFAGCHATNSRPLRASRRIPGDIFMPTIQPDNSDPMPLRTSPHRVGTLMMRFVGLLFLTVAVLALLYSR
jgi:hypothetical protein